MDKISKEELKRPDVFISTMGKAWHEVEKYRAVLMGILVSVAVFGAGFSVYSWFEGKKEAAAQSDLYLAQKSLQDLQKSFRDDPKAVAEAEKKDTPPPATKVKSGDLEKDLGPAVAQLEGVVAKHKGTRASVLAALELAPLYLEYKKPELAISALEKSQKAVSQKEFLAGFVQLRLGDAQQAQGKCDVAVQTWKVVSDAKDLTFLHSEALLRQGLCFESLNQGNQAAQVYQKLSADYAATEAGRTAKTFLRLIKNASN